MPVAAVCMGAVKSAVGFVDGGREGSKSNERNLVLWIVTDGEDKAQARKDALTGMALCASLEEELLATEPLVAGPICSHDVCRADARRQEQNRKPSGNGSLQVSLCHMCLIRWTAHAVPCFGGPRLSLCCKCLRYFSRNVTREDGLLSRSSSSSSLTKTKAQARGRKASAESNARLKSSTCMLAGQGFPVRGGFLPRTCRQRSTLRKPGAQEEPLRGTSLPPQADQWQHGRVAGERKMVRFP
jgi:hypothetical protein